MSSLRLIAVGYSMGGPIAQLFWRRHHERVEGLVLCATSRQFKSSDDTRLAIALLPALLPGVALITLLSPIAARSAPARAFLAARIKDPVTQAWLMEELAHSPDPWAIVQASRALGAFSSVRWINQVDVPAAVVVTLQDRLVPPAEQRALARAIPGAMIRLVNGGHDVCVARPDLFVPALVDACASVVRRKRGRS